MIRSANRAFVDLVGLELDLQDLLGLHVDVATVVDRQDGLAGVPRVAQESRECLGRLAPAMLVQRDLDVAEDPVLVLG